MKLDLHGIKHQNVQQELDQFFWKMMNNKKIEYVHVITGQSTKMKSIVYDVCNEYNFKTTEDYYNSGYVIVYLK